MHSASETARKGKAYPDPIDLGFKQQQHEEDRGSRAASVDSKRTTDEAGVEGSQGPFSQAHAPLCSMEKLQMPPNKEKNNYV